MLVVLNNFAEDRAFLSCLFRIKTKNFNEERLHFPIRNHKIHPVHSITLISCPIRPNWTSCQVISESHQRGHQCTNDEDASWRHRSTQTQFRYRGRSWPQSFWKSIKYLPKVPNNKIRPTQGTAWFLLTMRRLRAFGMSASSLKYFYVASQSYCLFFWDRDSQILLGGSERCNQCKGFNP